MTLLKSGMCPVLTEDVLRSFREHHIRSVSDLISADAEDLARESGVSYKVILAIRKVLFAQYAAIPFSGATLYQEVTSSVAILPTGCQSIDKLLDGGLYTCELVEVTGAAKSGKTQVIVDGTWIHDLIRKGMEVVATGARVQFIEPKFAEFCMTVSAHAAMHSQQNVMYIDTNGGFSPERLRDIMEQRGCTPQMTVDALRLIQCWRVFDAFDLLEILEEVRSKLEDQSGGETLPRIIIIDSVSAVLAPLLGGNQVDGQSLMCHIAQALKVLPVEFYTAVLVTNSVVRGEGHDEKKPSLGRSWLGVPHTRIMLKIGGQRDGVDMDKGCREAVLMKSQRQPTGATVQVVISEKGVSEP